MFLRMFAVYDSKALAFLQPFFSNSNGSAIRAFEDAVQDPKTPFFKHPGDYQLYELAGFDDSTGAVSPVHPTKLLCNGADFVPARRAAAEVGMPQDLVSEAIGNTSDSGR